MKVILLSLIHFILGIYIGHFMIHKQVSCKLNPSVSRTFRKGLTENLFQLSPNVQIVNLSESVNGNFECIKTKTLLNYISTNICLHDGKQDVAVSNSYRAKDTIWEEREVKRILQLLIRHPHLDFIDIGANIGAYTMYAAALGRFVLAVDCFGPNLDRIHRSVQLTNVANRVVLIQNAIFSRSGDLLRLSYDFSNIGGQELDASKKHNQSATNDPYIVKTIQFDDLAPILISHGVRGAIIKIDIEGSESFVVESGSRIFDLFEIPFIQMEWFKIRYHPERVKVVLDFFAQRNYDPMTFSCELLKSDQNETWPGDMCWIKRHVTGFCDVPDPSS